jgi:hypothetical protein
MNYLHRFFTELTPALAVSATLLSQLGDDALIAAPAALASVLLGHLSEKPERLAIAIWKRAALFLGSMALALVAGYLARQSADLAKWAGTAVVVTALFAQDVFMQLVAYKRRVLAQLNQKNDTET